MHSDILGGRRGPAGPAGAAGADGSDAPARLLGYEYLFEDGDEVTDDTVWTVAVTLTKETLVTTGALEVRASIIATVVGGARFRITLNGSQIGGVGRIPAGLSLTGSVSAVSAGGGGNNVTVAIEVRPDAAGSIIPELGTIIVLDPYSA